MSTIKLKAGHYEHNGWEIENVENVWVFREIGDKCWTDAANTLKEAKHLITLYKQGE